VKGFFNPVSGIAEDRPVEPPAAAAGLAVQADPAAQANPAVRANPAVQADPAAATLARLRQLGVSFISAEDLRPAPAPPKLPGQGHPYNSIFLPRAACPGQSVWSNNDDGPSPDSSLEMNSLALKYLNDAQLSRLAEQHRINSAATSGEGGGGETGKGGGGGVDMSFATQEFLKRHGLAQAGEYSQRPPLRTVANATGEAATLVARRTGAAPLRQLLAAQKTLAANQMANGVQSPFFVHQQRLQPPPPRPEISNRILDITAIRQQPKLL
jgi:hypothetical protein